MVAAIRVGGVASHEHVDTLVTGSTRCAAELDVAVVEFSTSAQQVAAASEGEDVAAALGSTVLEPQHVQGHSGTIPVTSTRTSNIPMVTVRLRVMDKTL